MLLVESGEDEIIFCPACGYAANIEKATSIKPAGKNEAMLAVEEVATPGLRSIDEVAGFLNITTDRTLKSVFYVCDGQVVFVVIRGDFEVNETKLKNVLKCTEMHMATEAEVQQTGIVAGYASPIGLEGIKIVADDSVKLGSNFVAGANKQDTHLKNVNFLRDFKADMIVDIAKARAGDPCPRCQKPAKTERGIEVGHVFKLGTFLSEKLGAYFLDRAIEQNHDEKGIIWPLPIAPFQVYLCPIKDDAADVARAAEKLYNNLTAIGVEVLFDDRPESPGVKFNDADLIGIPLRIVISPRTLRENAAEIKWRKEKDSQHLPLEGLAETIKSILSKALDASP